jgi:predicted N-acetyltransferase YhbS
MAAQGIRGRIAAEATERAQQAGFSKLAVISGIGVRPYYRKLGFERDGPYMSRFIYGDCLMTIGVTWACVRKLFGDIDCRIKQLWNSFI